MANGPDSAVTNATFLGEIPFVEFTTSLIQGVFDTLIAANLSQTEAYLELLAGVSKTLTQYVNDTKDEIDGAQILQFLTTVLAPVTAPDAEQPKVIEEGTELTTEEAGALDDALETTTPIAAGSLSKQQATDILEAVAKRIAANKYTLLQEMVKLGILRTVVNFGEIETKMTFTTYTNSYVRTTSSSYQRRAFELRAKAATGGLISKWVKASASTRYNSMSVSSAQTTQQDTSGSTINIFGRTLIRFKTDFLALDQA